MENQQFTHLIFWNNKIALLAYFCLGMSLISLWIKKTIWLWTPFLIVAIVLAFDAHIIQPLALIPMGILFASQECLTRNIYKPLRFILFGVVVITSLALAFHFLPGFNNWNLISNWQLSPDATCYSFYLNFDKPFIGIFVLALSLPLINSKEQWIKILKFTLPAMVIGIACMIAISIQIGMIRWDPKIPVFIFPWIIANMLFVCIPEEAFFRGFIQRELYLWFGKTHLSAAGSILITSFFFALLHLFWVGSFPFLCLVFLASVIYGILYQVTQAIESSILCHFVFNVVHFLLFTYPALQKMT